jgi:hypothetical protein
MNVINESTQKGLNIKKGTMNFFTAPQKGKTNFNQELMSN